MTRPDRVWRVISIGLIVLGLAFAIVAEKQRARVDSPKRLAALSPVALNPPDAFPHAD